MPWQCGLVEPAGNRYEVIYMSEQDDSRRPCIIHSRRYDIPEADWDDPDKFKKYKTDEPMICDHCGEFFTHRNLGVSFGAKTIWNTEDGKLHPGDMYYDLMGEEHFPSLEYKRDWEGKRKSLFVSLPDGVVWGIDQPASNSKNNSGWLVTGEAPNITARPSIAVHNYHGWLTNGVLSDDLEGRTYKED